MRYIAATIVLLYLQGCRTAVLTPHDGAFDMQRVVDELCQGTRPADWRPAPEETDVSWFVNGQDCAGPQDQIASQESYRYGKREGIWAEWYPNGQRKLEAFYKGDRLVGRASWWFEDGTLYASGVYKDGEPWDGTFADGFKLGIYEILTYEGGVLIAGGYPEWQKLNDPEHPSVAQCIREIPTRRGDLAQHTALDDYLFEGKWYPAFMAAFGVPELGGLTRGRQTTRCFRFVWLRTFDHPVCLTAILPADGDSGTIEARVLDGKGGYSPGKLMREYTRDLSKEQVADIAAALQGSRFLSQRVDFTETGLDGSNWIFEYLDGTSYVVRDYWSPAMKPDLVDLVERLLALANLGDEVVY